MPREAQRGPERPREISERARPKSAQFSQQLTYWEAAFLKGPNSPEKASKRNLVVSSQFYQRLTYWEAAFLKGHNSREKASKRPTGRPGQKSGQFYQQVTYWEAAFLKGPNSRKKAAKRPLWASVCKKSGDTVASLFIVASLQNYLCRFSVGRTDSI